MKQISESNSKILAQARFIEPFQLAICFALLQERVVSVYELKRKLHQYTARLGILFYALGAL